MILIIIIFTNTKIFSSDQSYASLCYKFIIFVVIEAFLLYSFIAIDIVIVIVVVIEPIFQELLIKLGFVLRVEREGKAIACHSRPASYLW